MTRAKDRPETMTQASSAIHQGHCFAGDFGEGGSVLWATAAKCPCGLRSQVGVGRCHTQLFTDKARELYRRTKNSWIHQHHASVVHCFSHRLTFGVAAGVCSPNPGPGGLLQFCVRAGPQTRGLKHKPWGLGASGIRVGAESCGVTPLYQMTPQGSCLFRVPHATSPPLCVSTPLSQHGIPV